MPRESPTGIIQKNNLGLCSKTLKSAYEGNYFLKEA